MIVPTVPSTPSALELLGDGSLEVQSTSLWVLLCLTIDSVANRNVLLDLHGVKALVEGFDGPLLMSESSSITPPAEVEDWYTRASDLMRDLAGTQTGREQIEKNHGIEAVVGALAKLEHSPEVVFNATQCLSSFAQDPDQCHYVLKRDRSYTLGCLRHALSRYQGLNQDITDTILTIFKLLGVDGFAGPSVEAQSWAWGQRQGGSVGGGHGGTMRQSGGHQASTNPPPDMDESGIHRPTTVDTTFTDCSTDSMNSPYRPQPEHTSRLLTADAAPALPAGSNSGGIGGGVRGRSPVPELARAIQYRHVREHQRRVLNRRGVAATKIQSAWRGHSARLRVGPTLVFQRISKREGAGRQQIQSNEITARQVLFCQIADATSRAVEAAQARQLREMAARREGGKDALGLAESLQNVLKHQRDQLAEKEQDLLYRRGQLEAEAFGALSLPIVPAGPLPPLEIAADPTYVAISEQLLQPDFLAAQRKDFIRSRIRSKTENGSARYSRAPSASTSRPGSSATRSGSAASARPASSRRRPLGSAAMKKRWRTEKERALAQMKEKGEFFRRAQEAEARRMEEMREEMERAQREAYMGLRKEMEEREENFLRQQKELEQKVLREREERVNLLREVEKLENRAVEIEGYERGVKREWEGERARIARLRAEQEEEWAAEDLKRDEEERKVRLNLRREHMQKAQAIALAKERAFEEERRRLEAEEAKLHANAVLVAQQSAQRWRELEAHPDFQRPSSLPSKQELEASALGPGIGYSARKAFEVQRGPLDSPPGFDVDALSQSAYLPASLNDTMKSTVQLPPIPDGRGAASKMVDPHDQDLARYISKKADEERAAATAFLDTFGASPGPAPVEGAPLPPAPSRPEPPPAATFAPPSKQPPFPLPAQQQPPLNHGLASIAAAQFAEIASEQPGGPPTLRHPQHPTHAPLDDPGLASVAAAQFASLTEEVSVGPY